MRSFNWIRGSLLAASLQLAACGGGVVQSSQTLVPDSGPPGNGTCTPSLEVCDGVDNDCDNQVDEGFDMDGDGFTTCGGDCDDLNARANPGSTEPAYDCDDSTTPPDAGMMEGPSQPGDDRDADGYTYPSDCDDRNASIGPGAIEILNDGIDNDCNPATTDTVATTCDPSNTSALASNFAKAMGLCSQVSSATFMTTAGAYSPSGARKIRAKFGEYWVPRQGTNMIHLSSGKAVDRVEDSSYYPDEGTRYAASTTHPAWSPSVCGPTDAVTVAKDMTELKLTIKVPQNANSLSFDFNFFSVEYPEYRCKTFNDRFVALLDSTEFKGNISFDKQGQAIGVNNENFSICNSSTGYTCAKQSELTKLNLTGYGAGEGGATDWLTTQAPVTPGETIILRLIVLDEGDDKLDSAVLIDNFKWQTFTVDGPTTDPVIG